MQALRRDMFNSPTHLLCPQTDDIPLPSYSDEARREIAAFSLKSMAAMVADILSKEDRAAQMLG